jgi:hypothetical protein
MPLMMACRRGECVLGSADLLASPPRQHNGVVPRRTWDCPRAAWEGRELTKIRAARENDTLFYIVDAQALESRTRSRTALLGTPVAGDDRAGSDGGLFPSLSEPLLAAGTQQWDVSTGGSFVNWRGACVAGIVPGQHGCMRARPVLTASIDNRLDGPPHCRGTWVVSRGCDRQMADCNGFVPLGMR